MDNSLKEYIETALVSERGYPSGTDKQLNQLSKYIEDNLEYVTDNFLDLAPKEQQQLFIVAAEFINGRAYITFLDGLLDKLNNGEINLCLVERAIGPKVSKIGFLAYNYEHKEVIDLCNKAKRILPDQSFTQYFLDSVLSGDRKKQSGAIIFMDKLPQPEILPAK